MKTSQPIRSKNNRERRKGESGSISIFLVIVVPIIIVALLSVFIAMRHHVNANKMMHVTADSSQVRLSLKSDLMSEQYRLLVYENDERLDGLLEDMAGENKLSGLYKWEIDSDCLDSPESYYASVKVAARYAFAEDTILALESKVSQMSSVKELAGKMKEQADKVSELGEKMKTKDLYKLAKKMKKADQILEKVQKFDEKLTDKEASFMETYNAIKEKTEMVEEAKGQFDQKNQEMRAKIEKIKSLGNDQENLTRSIDASEHKIDQWEDEIDTLKRQEREAEKAQKEREKEAAADGSPSGAKPSQSTSHSSVDYQPQINALRDQIDREESRIDDLERQRDQVNQQIKDKASSLTDFLKQTSCDWVEELKALKELAFDESDEEDDDTKDRDQMDKVEEDDLYTHNGSTFDKSQVVAYDKVMIDEYFLSIYSDRLEDKREHGPFKSEVEYLLTGNENEKVSKFQVRSEIFGVRELCNIMAVMMDGEAQTKILEMCSPLPYPYKVIAYGVINLAWASAESYLDTQKLCNGDSLPLIKSTHDFELSLTGIKNLDTKTVKNKTKAITTGTSQKNSGNKGSNKKGLEVDYEDHLRLLLFTQGFDKTLLRSMDLMTWSLSDNDKSLGDFARGHHIKVIEDDRLLLEMDNYYE